METSRLIFPTKTKYAQALKRPPVREGSCVLIYLTLGQVAVIDLVDSELAALNWCALKGKLNKTYYAIRSQVPISRLYLHREIAKRMGLEIDGFDVDHIDGNGLNNRRSNLRPATKSQSLINRPIPANNTSGFKGVTWVPGEQKWAASISCERKRYSLGHHDTVEEAAAAYQTKAAELHGAYARRT